MVFIDIDSKLEPSYISANDDNVNDFYNFALSEAIKYDRILGYFNSNSLDNAARGVYKFIKIYYHSIHEETQIVFLV